MPKRKIKDIAQDLQDEKDQYEQFARDVLTALEANHPAYLIEAIRPTFTKRKTAYQLHEDAYAKRLERANTCWIPKKCQTAVVSHLQNIMDHIGTLNRSNPLISIKGSDESSHHRALTAGVITDPYNLYQADNSHGFCQTFALMIANNATDTLLTIEPTDTSMQRFVKYAHNSKAAYNYALSIPGIPKTLSPEHQQYLNFFLAEYGGSTW